MSPRLQTFLVAMIAALVSALFTGLGAYLTLGRNVVTTEALPGLIAVYSPYISDRNQIEAQLQNDSSNINSLASSVQTLRETVASLAATVQALAQKKAQ